MWLFKITPELIIAIVAIVVSGCVTLFAVWLTNRANLEHKTLELQAARDNRGFEFDKEITLRSLAVMKDACYKLRRLVTAYALYKSSGGKNRDEAKYIIGDAADFIAENKPLLPSPIRAKVFDSSYALRGLFDKFETVPKELDEIRIFAGASKAAQDSLVSIETFLDEHNWLSHSRDLGEHQE